MKVNYFFLFILLFLASPFICNAEVNIVPLENWSNVFGGEDVSFHFIVSSNETTRGRVIWHYSNRKRTISRGEKAVALQAGGNSTIEVILQIPFVKNGTTIDTDLKVSFLESTSSYVEATCYKRIWIFYKNPFLIVSKWLEAQNIHLFDPNTLTTELFKNSGIPFKFVRNLGSIGKIENGLLIIGEGTSFKINRGLWKMILEIVNSGIPVLLLAPRDGELIVPGSMVNNLSEPMAISYRKSNFIRELNKTIDSVGWSPDGLLISKSFKLKGYRGNIIAEVIKNENGFSLIQMDFNSEMTKIVACTFPIVEKWNLSPAPRFLLKHLLEYMTKISNTEKNDGFD